MFEAEKLNPESVIKELCDWICGKHMTLNSLALIAMFDLLQVFSDQKFKYAPVLYRKLNELFLRNFDN